MPVERGHHHELIAVDELAVLVDRDDPVGVAVEREPEIRAARSHRRLQLLGIRRSARGVDVATVGLGVQHVDARARGPQRARRELRRRAVRAVDHDVQPGQRPTLERTEQMRDVLVEFDLPNWRHRVA